MWQGMDITNFLIVKGLFKVKRSSRFSVGKEIESNKFSISSGVDSSSFRLYKLP